MAEIVFWAASAVLLWVYAGYPLTALLVGRLRGPARRRDLVGEPPPAFVTVGIAVHNGEQDIAARVANVLEQEVDRGLEVVVASDGSTDATPAIVAHLAATDERLRLLRLPRAGQSAAQSAIFSAARGAIVVLTDAETRFAPGCLAALLAPFADPRVACVTGVLRWRFDRATDTAQHEGLYWRYEQAVRAWESRAGWMTAVTGALLAVRRSAYRPVPAHASLDQLLPLHAHDQGLLVLAVAGATGTDRGSSGVGEQFRNRVRIATQGIAANLSMAHRLTPWRRPGACLAIWSHKLLRWATPWLVLITGVAGIVAAWSGAGAAYWLPLVGAGLVGGWALAGWLLRRRGVALPGSGFPFTLVVVNAAFALAWLRVVSGRRNDAWPSGGAG